MSGSAPMPPTGQPGSAAGMSGGVGGMAGQLGSGLSTGYDLNQDHIRNQRITSQGVMGGGTGGAGLSAGYSFPTSNPMNAGGSPQFGSANYYLRQIASTDAQIAANTSGGAIPPSFGAHTPWQAGGGSGGRFNYGPGGPGAGSFVGSFGHQFPQGAGGFIGGFGPPPRGGGGGGGGNRGGWGGGGGGNAATPFASYFGLGATAGIFGKSGLGLMAADAALALEEGFFLPQNAGKIAGSALSNAAPYQDIRLSMAAIGRTGGFSGLRLSSGMGGEEDPGGAPPKWMQEAGIGPAEAAKLLRDFSIRPNSAIQGIGIAQGLSRLPLDYSGMSSLPSGMAANSASNAARMGMLSPDRQGIQQWANILDVQLAKAVEQGVDASQLMRSIDASMSTAAQSGGSIGGIANIAGFLSKFNDMPGRSEAGLHAMGGIQGALSTVGTNSARTVAMSEWFGKLKTEGDLKNLFDQNNGPGSWEQYTKDPGNRTLADRYLRQRGQNNFLGIQTLSELVNSPGGASVGQYMLANNAVSNATGNRDTAAMSASYLGGTSQRETDAIARSGYRNMVSAMAKQKGLPESLMLSLVQQESGFDPMALGGSGEMGLMQMMPGTATHMGLKGREAFDPYKNLDKGMDYYKEMLALFNGDHEKALRAFNWGPGHRDEIRAGRVPPKVGGYSSSIINRANQMVENKASPMPGVDPQSGVGPTMHIADMSPESNLPGDILGGRAQALTMGISGSRQTSQEMNIIMPKASSALGTVEDGATKLMAEIGKFVAAVRSGRINIEGLTNAFGGGTGLPLQ